jgi:hypothetical protein
MELFSGLLVGHLIGDFIFQTRWMQRKTQEWFPLLVHSAVYTISVIVMALPCKRMLSWWAILLIFGSHIILDQRKFVQFWAEKITGTSNIEWLKIALDQSWHIVILGVATII